MKYLPLLDICEIDRSNKTNPKYSKQALDIQDNKILGEKIVLKLNKDQNENLNEKNSLHMNLTTKKNSLNTGRYSKSAQMLINIFQINS